MARRAAPLPLNLFLITDYSLVNMPSVYTYFLDSFFQYEFQGSRKSKCQLGSDSYHYSDKVN